MPKGIYKHPPQCGFQKGNVPWNRGKPRSEETKKKISKNNGRYFLGKQRTEKTKRKIGNANKITMRKYYDNGGISHRKGKKASMETKRKLSESHMGQIPWNKKEKIIKKCAFCGRDYEIIASRVERSRFCSYECRGRYYNGEKSCQWQGGKSFEPYGLAFNNKLKEVIRKRDSFRCQECFRHQDELYSKSGRKYKLHIHHIDYNKKNNNQNNLISLCRSCHSQTNFGREDWTNYFNKKL